MFNKDKLIGLLPAFVRKQFLQKNSSGAIFRNMAYLSTGTAGAQALGFLLTPIVTRIYTPEHFGILAIFTSMLALVVPLVTLRYSVAIPLPKNSGLAVNIVVLCLSITLVMSAILGLVFFEFGEAIFNLVSMPELIPYWWVLSIGILGTGLYETFSSWALREKQFKILARTKINQTVSGNLVKIGLGLLAMKPIGLLIGQVISQAAGFMTILWKSRKRLKKGLERVTKSRILLLAKYYSNFPKFQIGSRFLLAFSSQAPLFFMVSLFNPEVTGQLSLALTVLAIPMALIGRSVGQAYYAEIAEIGPKFPRKIEKITKDISKKLFFVSLVPFVILLIGGPWLFTIIFGSEWTEAGWYASMLSISLLSQFLSSPIANTLSVFRKEDYYLKINMVRTLIIIIAFGISYLLSLNALYTVLTYSIFITIHRFLVYSTILRMVINR